MPAHWCIYKFMFYIYLIKYLFNISEYKVMLIKLLNLSYKYRCMYVYIYIYIYIYVCVCVYIYIYVCVCVYIYIYIYQKVQLKYRIDKRSNTVKTLTIPIPN